ncbi:hypothetical protein ACFQ6U_05005 [Streptomyces sp. NPDC056465]|uniref:hypothetical protein n=1 Tax=Streptomyces sp. NPDC056465 TaxID=3345829 RepID=UPI0036CBB695
MGKPQRGGQCHQHGEDRACDGEHPPVQRRDPPTGRPGFARAPDVLSVRRAATPGPRRTTAPSAAGAARVLTAAGPLALCASAP